MHRGFAMVVSALVALPAYAQQPLTERIEVAVTNVEVTVTDHGKPVHGLTADDFEIFEDRQPQKITNFSSVEEGDGAASEERLRRKVLLIVPMTLSANPWLARAIERLDNVIRDRFRGDYEWSVAILDGTLRMVLPPTTDKAAIHATLDALRRISLRARIRANPGEPSDSIADALLQATHAFGGTKGRKIILLMTSSLLQDDRFTRRFQLRDGERGQEQDFLIEEANTSNIAVSILNPGHGAFADSAMFWVTRATGGRLGTSDNAEDLARFDAASSNFYSLGYQPRHGDDSKYHRLKVRLKDHRYDLQYREGYTSIPDDARVQLALESPFGLSLMAAGNGTLPVSLVFDAAREAQAGHFVELTASVPADRVRHGRIHFYLSVFDDTGRSVRSTEFDRDPDVPKDPTPAAVVSDRIDQYFMTGRRYRVVVSVYDSITGELGIAEKTIAF